MQACFQQVIDITLTYILFIYIRFLSGRALEEIVDEERRILLGEIFGEQWTSSV